MNNHSNLAPSAPNAADLVRRAFEHDAWQIKEQVKIRGRRPDFIISDGDLSYAVEVKAVPRGSSSPIEDAWSRACLQARFYANEANSDLRPLAVVVAPRVSHAALERLAQFASDYAPDVAMGVIDHRGLQSFIGKGLESLNQEAASDSIAGPRQPRSRRNLFSDLNQWLLKVLFSPDVPESMLSAPRARHRNASELAAAAGCSVMSAHRFVEQLSLEGFLDEASPHLRLVRRGELLRRWKISQHRRGPEIRYRMAVSRPVRDSIARWFPNYRACLGYFAAAEELGAGFVRGVPPHVLLESSAALPRGMQAAEAARELIEAKESESYDLVVQLPKAKRSIFNGVVRPNGVPCSDIIQVWLDVSEHPSRGKEQAALIFEKYFAEIVAGDR